MAASMPAVAKARKPLLVRRERLRACLALPLRLDDGVRAEDFVDLPRELELRLEALPDREDFDADEPLRPVDPCLEALARVVEDDVLEAVVRLRDPDDLDVVIVRSSFVP
ncbi:MAG: hypothetical protein ACI4B6_08375 [Atopobiaceae bacterium]